MLNRRNRTRKWAGVFLCIFFASLKAFAEPVSIEGQKTSSWTDYFSRFLVFWQDDADRKADTSQHSTDVWKKIPVDFSDFLPDNLPGYIRIPAGDEISALAKQAIPPGTGSL